MPEAVPIASTDPGAPARPLAWWRRPAFGVGALVVVLAVALAVGGGLGSARHLTDAQRAASLDTQLRCPSCEDLSVAESQASDAVAVRDEVAKLVAEGRTDTQVDDALVAQYGQTILLRPPDSGLTSLVWILPVAGALVAAGALGVLFVRRSRSLRRLDRAGR
jgi:cytochrome c-type biogenesis protein CcmH